MTTRRHSTWTPAALSKLGYVSDGEIARELGITLSAVQQRRRRMGIPSADAPRGPAPRNGTAASVRVTVNLTPMQAEEYASAAAAAGVSVSRWLATVADNTLAALRELASSD